MVGATKGPRSRFQIESAPVFLERVRKQPAPKMLVDELVPEDAVVLIHGQPRTRKTFAALEIAVSIAGKLRAFHLERFRCRNAAPVIFLTEEDSEHEIAKRLDGISRAHGFNAPPKELYLVVRQGLNLDEREQQGAIIEAVKEHKAKLLIIDPTRAYTACVDGGPREWKPFGDFLRRLRRETKVTVILSHHDVKPSRDKEDQRDPAQRASGGGIFSSSEAPISVTRVGDRESHFKPNAYKLAGTDPDAFVVRITEKGTFKKGDYVLTVLGETKTEGAAKVDAIKEKALAYIRENPCLPQSKIAKVVHRRTEDVKRALESLEQEEVIVKTKKKGRGLSFHYRVSGTKSCGGCE